MPLLFGFNSLTICVNATNQAKYFFVSAVNGLHCTVQQLVIEYQLSKMQKDFIIPIVIMVILFIVVNYTRVSKAFNFLAFVRLRILFVCVFIGYLISYAINNSSVKTIVISSLLGLILLYSVYQLQQKHFKIKEQLSPLSYALIIISEELSSWDEKNKCHLKLVIARNGIKKAARQPP